MPNYRELLQQVKRRDRRGGRRARPRAPRLGRPAALPRHPRAGRVGRGADPRRRPHPARQPRVAHRERRARPRAADRRLLRRRQPLRVRREDARASSATRTSSRSPAASPTGSATASRRSCRASLDAEKRARYSRHLLIPEVGVEGQLKLLELARAPDRRRRPRLARVASISPPPASGGSASSTTTASTRRTSSARSRTRPSGSATGRPTRPSSTLEALNPDVEVDHVQGADHLGERRPHPRRRLGRDRRRRRQLPDALSHQRRLGVPRHPRRARLDLPLRGPGNGVQAP